MSSWVSNHQFQFPSQAVCKQSTYGFPLILNSLILLVINVFLLLILLTKAVWKIAGFFFFFQFRILFSYGRKENTTSQNRKSLKVVFLRNVLVSYSLFVFPLPRVFVFISLFLQKWQDYLVCSYQDLLSNFD